MTNSALLESTLAAGTTLVVDRYAYSGVAFTAAKARPELDMAWCKARTRARSQNWREANTCRGFALTPCLTRACQAPDRGLPAPDAVLLLTLSPEAAAARGEYGAERYERVDFQKAVAAQFAALREPWWTPVDAARTPDEVAADVAAGAEAALSRARRGAPLRRLWQEDSA